MLIMLELQPSLWGQVYLSQKEDHQYIQILLKAKKEYSDLKDASISQTRKESGTGSS